MCQSKNAEAETETKGEQRPAWKSPPNVSVTMTPWATQPPKKRTHIPHHKCLGKLSYAAAHVIYQ